jgi:hypothetical protein
LDIIYQAHRRVFEFFSSCSTEKFYSNLTFI